MIAADREQEAHQEERAGCGDLLNASEHSGTAARAVTASHTNSERPAMPELLEAMSFSPTRGAGTRLHLGSSFNIGNKADVALGDGRLMGLSRGKGQACAAGNGGGSPITP